MTANIGGPTVGVRRRCAPNKLPWRASTESSHGQAMSWPHACIVVACTTKIFTLDNNALQGQVLRPN